MPTEGELVFAAIARMRDVLFRHATPVIREAGLTMGQFEVLEALSAHGPMSVGEVRDAVFGTKGNIPLVIKNLERDGLVRRTCDDRDGRVSVIELTPEGAERVEYVYPQVVASIDRDLAALTSQEKRQLVHLLHKAQKSAAENN